MCVCPPSILPIHILYILNRYPTHPAPPSFPTRRSSDLSFPRGDLRSATGRLPSRFLLPTLRHLSGNPRLAATAWDTVGYTAVHSSSSFAGELLSTETLATEQEWRGRPAAAGGREGRGYGERGGTQRRA